MTIKAIETKYNGYRFRSRLEARWAVFFDTMGIEYQYEPEGYEIDGIRYLPDFLLPQLDLRIEIKGVFPSRDEQTKIVKLTKNDDRHPLAVFYGDPNPDHHILWWAGRCLQHFMFIECEYCGTIGWVSISRQINAYFYILRCEHKPLVTKSFEKNKFVPLPDKSLAAYEAARSARFEYGETPRVPRGKPKK